VPPDSVSLLSFGASTHVPLLELWLRRPQVARWFGAPEPHLAFARHVPPRGDHALIAYGSAPIGYIRWQAVTREVLDAVGLSDITAGAVDVDREHRCAACVRAGGLSARAPVRATWLRPVLALSCRRERARALTRLLL
jgi:hypothetical protein